MLFLQLPKYFAFFLLFGNDLKNKLVKFGFSNV